MSRSHPTASQAGKIIIILLSAADQAKHHRMTAFRHVHAMPNGRLNRTKTRATATSRAAAAHHPPAQPQSGLAHATPPVTKPRLAKPFIDAASARRYRCGAVSRKDADPMRTHII